MAARNGGILKSLLKIVVRQFLDDKHSSKLAATVTIDQKYSFKCFHSKLILELMFFSKENVSQCFEMGGITSRHLTMRKMSQLIVKVYIHKTYGHSLQMQVLYLSFCN